MFAIYPTVDEMHVRDHAVVFTDDIDLAGMLCHHFHMDRGLTHEAYLVLDSWPDAKLMNNLNGCGPNVFFSARSGTDASNASIALLPVLKRLGKCDPCLIEE